MYFVGTPSVMARRLVETTYEAMWRGIRAVRPGPPWATSAMPSRAMPKASVSAWCASTAATASARSTTTSRRWCITTARQGLVLQPGMTFTIEPMINEGTRYNKVLPDGWTVVTKDRKLSAQWGAHGRGH